IVWPTCTVAVAGLTVTDATGTVVTVIAAVPLFPSLVAVSVAAPTATPVACPAPFTVATAGLLLDQVTVRPPSGLPNASRVIAAYCAVCPTPIVAVAGVTLTDATGSGHPVTVTLAAMETFPGWLVAVTVKVPQVALVRSEEHTSELQSRFDLVCRLLLEKKKQICPLWLPSTAT